MIGQVNGFVIKRRFNLAAAHIQRLQFFQEDTGVAFSVLEKEMKMRFSLSHSQEICQRGAVAIRHARQLRR